MLSKISPSETFQEQMTWHKVNCVKMHGMITRGSINTGLMGSVEPIKPGLILPLQQIRTKRYGLLSIKMALSSSISFGLVAKAFTVIKLYDVK